MIKTSRQLKDKIKNLTHGDSLKSQTLLRTYMMERFLERLAVSQYNSHFVLKGGMLVSSMVGIHQRATMDIDATVVALRWHWRTLHGRFKKSSISTCRTAWFSALPMQKALWKNMTIPACVSR